MKELENFLKRTKNKNFSIDGQTCSIFFQSIIKKNNKINKVIDPIYFLKSQKKLSILLIHIRMEELFLF